MDARRLVLIALVCPLLAIGLSIVMEGDTVFGSARYVDLLPVLVAIGSVVLLAQHLRVAIAPRRVLRLAEDQVEVGQGAESRSMPMSSVTSVMPRGNAWYSAPYVTIFAEGRGIDVKRISKDDVASVVSWLRDRGKGVVPAG